MIHVKQHEVLWSNERCSLLLARELHSSTNGGWNIATNEFVLVGAPEEIVGDGTFSPKVGYHFTKHEARALAVVLLEFSRSEP